MGRSGGGGRGSVRLTRCPPRHDRSHLDRTGTAILDAQTCPIRAGSRDAPLVMGIEASEVARDAAGGPEGIAWQAARPRTGPTVVRAGHQPGARRTPLRRRWNVHRERPRVHSRPCWIRTAPSLRAKGVTMDRETEAAPRQATPADGLPPIFQRPTYPSGEPATRAPERAPDEPRESSKRPEAEPPADRAPSRSPRTRAAAVDTEKAPARRRPAPAKTDDDGPPAEAGGSDGSQAPRRRSRGGRGRGGRGRGGSTGTARDETGTDTAEPAEGRTDDGAEDGRRRQGTRGGRSRSGAAVKEPEQTPGSQRDDAQPDDRTAGGRRRTRRRTRLRMGRGRQGRDVAAVDAAGSGRTRVRAAPRPRPSRNGRNDRNDRNGRSDREARRRSRSRWRPADPRAGCVRARSEAGVAAVSASRRSRRRGSPTN